MASPTAPPPSPPSPHGRNRSRSSSGERAFVAMASPAQLPPSPPPRRGRSPSGERAFVAMASPAQLPPSPPPRRGRSPSGERVFAAMASPAPPPSSPPPPRGRKRSRSPSGEQVFAAMASAAQPPPSPPPPHGRKRSGSSGERELGAEFDPQFSPPGVLISLGPNASLGINSKEGSTSMNSAKAVFAEAKGVKFLSNGDLDMGKPESSFVHKIGGCQDFTYNELYAATSGFSQKNEMPQFGPFVYQGHISFVGKVLVKVYEKVEDKLEEYKEGVLRRFSQSRAHKNIIELIGSFSDEKTLILVYDFPFEVCLGDQLQVLTFESEKGGLATYARYKIAMELAEALNHIVKQDLPIIPNLFTEEQVFVGPKGNPILVDFIGAAQGLGQSFDSTLEIVRHYGILLGKLRTVCKCANGVELPICDEVWEKLEKDCIQANEFKRPSPEYIAYVMKERTKELFSLTSPMHDEFRRKYNLEW